MKGVGAWRSTESTFSLTSCSEGSGCGGVLQVSMLADKLEEERESHHVRTVLLIVFLFFSSSVNKELEQETS